MPENDNIDEFLRNLGMKGIPVDNQWDKIVVPDCTYMLTGDIGTGKSALAYWLLEYFSQKYSMAPVTVGLPHNKRELLPEYIQHLDEPKDCSKKENSIILIDEADLQLPLEDTKQRKEVVNFLSLPRQRHQILILSFHYPRLILSRYLPYFNGGLFFKRPPYLLEFAGKTKNDSLVKMMQKAEERFAELPLEKVKLFTYVIAPRLRWQGLLANTVPTFWSEALSKVWAGVEIKADTELKQPGLFTPQEETVEARLTRETVALFPEGLTQEIIDTLVQFDQNYTLEQLREMCAKEGLSVNGHKKLLAARLVAKDRGL